MTDTDLWTDEGVAPGGTVGGDGAGESISRRFHQQLADGTYVAVESYWYPVNIGERFGEDREDAGMYDVENMTCVTVCTDIEDPGMSEISSEYTYDFPSYTSFPTEADAIAYSEQQAKNDDPGNYGDPKHWGITV